MTPAPDNHRVGLKDIAARIGVSRMTVSRALRGTSYVEAGLKARILQEAKRLGYSANPVVSDIMGALRHSKKPDYRETIAVLFARPEPYYQVTFAGIHAMAEQLSYRVDLISHSKERLRSKTITRMLRARGIRGVIIMPPEAETSHPHVTLEWRHFSTVLIGSSLANHGIARVQSDHFGSGKFLVRQLQHLGYRRIGLMLRKRFHERSNRQFQAAFHAWHPRQSEADSMIYFFPEEPDPQTCRKWIEACRPDCVVAHTLWLKRLALDKKFSLPATCGLASLAVEQDRVFTGIHTERIFYEIGAEAMRYLDSQLRNGIFGLQERPRTLLIPTDWQKGLTAPGGNGVPEWRAILSPTGVSQLAASSSRD